MKKIIVNGVTFGESDMSACMVAAGITLWDLGSYWSWGDTPWDALCKAVDAEKIAVVTTEETPCN